jgi:hypothetical protein
MKSQTLKPERQTLQLKGKLSYSESNRAWNTIRFKKELINEFPILKERRGLFGYTIILYRNYAELERATRKIKKNNDPIPMMLLLEKR